MGKASILLLIATGIVVMYGVTSSQETTKQTARHQVDFEEGVIAREIARTGFNMAMGVMRSFGDDLQAGVVAVNGTEGHMQGNSQGGTFRAVAQRTTGHEVEISSVGCFGEFLVDGSCSGTAYTIDDNFQVGLANPPLQVTECSRMNTQFISSIAGYCSAIYLQRYLPDTPPGEQPAPEMIFSAGNNRNGGSATVSYLIQPGTQMNLFLAVDKHCNKGTSSHRQNWENYDVENHVFNPAHYDHIHNGLDINMEQVGEELVESPWAMLEQHPDNDQRWRIAWEDLNHPQWDNPNSTDHTQSLQALKRYGYDGNGWETDAQGYLLLKDYWLLPGKSDNGHHTSYRPDFSDQVIEIWMTPEPESCGTAGAVEV